MDIRERYEAFRVTWREKELLFKLPAGTSRGVMRSRKLWYVEVSCKLKGKTYWGIGECAPLSGLSCDDCANYETILSQACIAWERDRVMPRERLIDFPSILMGFETAERSLLGSISEKGAYALWNSSFFATDDGIRINGLVWMGTAEEMEKRMEEKLRAGFGCVKLKIGAIDFERELSLIRSLRERYTPAQVELRLDANGAFPPAQALERLHRLAPFGIHSIEQPIRAGQWDAMRDLCEKSPIPIALDEELIGVNRINEKEALLDMIRPQYIILKPSLHGGFSGCAEWERLADARNIDLWYTSALESNVGLNSIAQWASRYSCEHPSGTSDCEPEITVRDLNLPQGLGTGQLFVENYAALPLYVEGERLYFRSKLERFEREISRFREIWFDEKTSKVSLQTSGSTGVPQRIDVEKGAMRASAMRTLRALRLKEGDRALLCLPVAYVAGKMMLVRAWEGKLSLEIVPPSLHPFALLTEAPDFVALTPAQAAASYGVEAERRLMEKTRCILLGGGKVDEQLEAQLQSCRGEVWSSYGMTETLSHISLRHLNGSEREEGYRPLEGVSIKVNGEGCLVIADQLLGIEQLVTHDLAEIAEDGTFVVHGRTDNVVNSGGLKLHLEDLEEKLRTLPFRLAMTSLPDAILGEALVLLVEASPSARELCKDKGEDLLLNVEVLPSAPLFSLLRTHLSPHCVPKRAFLVESIPTTETGKPARARIRDLVMRLSSDCRKE